jgi:hypothetical protein
MHTNYGLWLPSLNGKLLCSSWQIFLLPTIADSSSTGGRWATSHHTRPLEKKDWSRSGISSSTFDFPKYTHSDSTFWSDPANPQPIKLHVTDRRGRYNLDFPCPTCPMIWNPPGSSAQAHAPWNFSLALASVPFLPENLCATYVFDCRSWPSLATRSSPPTWFNRRLHISVLPIADFL